jgi:cytochrome c oxidase subunit 2
MAARSHAAMATVVLLGTAGCSGVQSALAPGGRQAADIAGLYWWMAIGSLIVWLGVVAVAVWCVRWSSGVPDRRRDRALIIGGGTIIPLIVLTVLLTYGLIAIPPLVARAPAGSLSIAVTGERWWWRVRYEPPGGAAVPVANELYLPVNELVQFRLNSHDVIHSFWMPSLGPKMDMIPGRITWLALEPTQIGWFRGTCAEFCGGSHALMGFDVRVTGRPAFEKWLAHQAAPAAVPPDAIARHGYDLFFAAGCSACHTIRGTPAAGVIGPDLTHVGSRRTLAASVLPNDVDAFRRWMAHPGHIKPRARMPRFGMLADADLKALATFLEGLE